MTASVEAGVGYADLLNSVQELLAAHPEGDAITLMITPPALNLAPDEVLVQVTDGDSRSISLVPRRISDLHSSDVPVDSQILDGTDYRAHAGQPRPRCLVVYPDGRNSQHIHN